MTPRETLWKYLYEKPSASLAPPKWIPVFGEECQRKGWLKDPPMPTPMQEEQLREIARANGHYFIDESQAYVTIYTDGSGLPTGGDIGYAAILIAQNGKKKEVTGGGTGTNQVAELSAIDLGLSQLKKPFQVRLISDSQYCLNTMKFWAKVWKRRCWRRSGTARNEVSNLDIIKRLYQFTREHWIEYNWVKGHNGNELNERCDELAGLARKPATPEPEFF